MKSLKFCIQRSTEYDSCFFFSTSHIHLFSFSFFYHKYLPRVLELQLLSIHFFVCFYIFCIFLSFLFFFIITHHQLSVGDLVVYLRVKLKLFFKFFMVQGNQKQKIWFNPSNYGGRINKIKIIETPQIEKFFLFPSLML